MVDIVNDSSDNATASETGPTVVFGVRLSHRTVRELDAYAHELRADQPGRRASRADAVRLLVARGLEHRRTEVK